METAVDISKLADAEQMRIESAWGAQEYNPRQYVELLGEAGLDTTQIAEMLEGYQAIWPIDPYKRK